MFCCVFLFRLQNVNASNFLQNLNKILIASYLCDCFLCVTMDGDLEAVTHKHRWPLTSQFSTNLLCLSKVKMLVGGLSVHCLLSSLSPFPPPPALQNCKESQRSETRYLWLKTWINAACDSNFLKHEQENL